MSTDSVPGIVTCSSEPSWCVAPQCSCMACTGRPSPGRLRAHPPAPRLAPRITGPHGPGLPLPCPHLHCTLSRRWLPAPSRHSALAVSVSPRRCPPRPRIALLSLRVQLGGTPPPAQPPALLPSPSARPAVCKHSGPSSRFPLHGSSSRGQSRCEHITWKIPEKLSSFKGRTIPSRVMKPLTVQLRPALDGTPHFVRCPHALDVPRPLTSCQISYWGVAALVFRAPLFCLVPRSHWSVLLLVTANLVMPQS